MKERTVPAPAGPVEIEQGREKLFVTRRIQEMKASSGSAEARAMLRDPGSIHLLCVGMKFKK